MTLYTGIAVDANKRFETHSKKTSEGAKYTRSHTVKEIKAVWSTQNRSNALKLESRIKKLTRKKKLELISDNSVFDMYFTDIDTDQYTRIK